MSKIKRFGHEFSNCISTVLPLTMAIIPVYGVSYAREILFIRSITCISSAFVTSIMPENYEVPHAFFVANRAASLLLVKGGVENINTLDLAINFLNEALYRSCDHRKEYNVTTSTKNAFVEDTIITVETVTSSSIKLLAFHINHADIKDTLLYIMAEATIILAIPVTVSAIGAIEFVIKSSCEGISNIIGMINDSQEEPLQS